MRICSNVGTVDRVIRLALAVGLLASAFAFLDIRHGAVLGIVAAVAGVIMLVTAAIGFCPLYLPFKASTCKV